MKRGLSGLSLVVGINKPTGMTSHDVVNKCRRIFGESRIGHSGTLDPGASGALLICIGPATRLNPYLTMHDKSYRFKVSFGAATDTDDSSGRIIRTGSINEDIYDPFFAQSFLARLLGAQQQIPPVYSAIKVKGERSYKAARSGNAVDLKPRDIEIYGATLMGIEEGSIDDLPSWDISVRVSKGTYIRSLARDIGNALGTPAHVSRLCRTSLGSLSLDECIDLETLGTQKTAAAIDPVNLLGFRFAFACDETAGAIKHGCSLPMEGKKLFSYPKQERTESARTCLSWMYASERPMEHDEMISIIAKNKLVALYQFDQKAQSLKPRCVFSVEVSRDDDS